MPLYLFMLHQKRAPIFYTCYTQILVAESNLSFSFCLENLLLRESPFHMVNYLKLFNFALFFVYTLKFLKSPLWHIFLLYFEKHMTFSTACGSKVVHQLLNKTMQKLSAKVKRGPATSLKKGAPRRQPCSSSLISTPALNYIQQKELASFYNTIEFIKVL